MFPDRRAHAQRRHTIVTNARGLGILEWTGGLVPQGGIVTAAKLGWKQIWLAFMRELAPQSSKGEYQRPGYAFDGAIGEGEFPLELNGRYVLYIGNPCPWCHRVLMAVALRGLESTVIRVVQLRDDPEKASRGGWVMAEGREPYFGATDLRQIYDACTPGGYTGRCTAPLLVDTKAKKIVSNESSSIVTMLNRVHVSDVSSAINLRPEELCRQIDELNATLFDTVNNGVYKCGFATEQAAYDAAFQELYAVLEDLNAQLATRRFLLGDKFTEADLRLFPTAARFDPVYAILFKCTRRWSEFEHLQRWYMDCAMLPIPGRGNRVLLSTVDVDDCKRSYFTQLFPLNPGGIVPGPDLQRVCAHSPSSTSKDNRGEIQSVYYTFDQIMD